MLWPAGTTFGSEMLTSSPSWPLRSALSEFPEESWTSGDHQIGVQLAFNGSGRRLRLKFHHDARIQQLAFGHKRSEDLVGDGAKSRLSRRLRCDGGPRPHGRFDLREGGAKDPDQTGRGGEQGARPGIRKAEPQFYIS